MQRVLVAIPHFFDRSGAASAQHDSAQAGSAAKRAAALTTIIVKLHELFGQPYLLAEHTQQHCSEFAGPDRMELEICVITNGDNHLVKELACAPHLYRHIPAVGEPRWLGLAAHKLIAQTQGHYDWYCYLEDDTAIEDALFFDKLRHVYGLLPPDAILQPMRYETELDAGGHALPAPRKLYPDFECGDALFEGPAVNVEVLGRTWTLEPARHPHAGCFFLDKKRATLFVASKYCGEAVEVWVTPPDTAASLALMRTFRIYKPARDSLAFLEVRHLRPAMIGNLKGPDGGPYLWT
jgi:hypothetical protein